MRLIKTTATLLTIFLMQFASAGNEVTIKLKIKGLKDTICLLANHYGDKQYIQDTLKVDSQGRITIDKKEKYKGGIYLMVLPNKKYFEFIMDETQNFTLETDTSDLVGNMKVKGSQENTLFYQYLSFISTKQKEVEPLRIQYEKVKEKKDSADVIQKKINVIDKEVADYKAKFAIENAKSFAGKLMKAMTEIEVPDPPKLPNGRTDSTFQYKYYKAHFWDNIDFTDDRILRSPVYHGKMMQYLNSVTVQIPDSIIKEVDFLLEKTKNTPELFKYTAHTITYNYETSKIMGMDAIFVHMVEEVYLPGKGVWLDSAQTAKIVNRGLTLKPLLLGKIAPELILLDTNNTVKTLHRTKGKYTVLIFWDYDCGHCKKEVPKLLEVYHKYRDKGVEVYAVSTEYDIKKWKDFIREHKLDWINVADPNHQTNFKKQYDIFSTPVIYVLNEKKEIVAKRINSEQVGDMMERMFKEKP